MPHGQADFGMYAVKETVASLSDMAELAARLKSIVTLDRRGDVVFLEDFEAPILNWEPIGVGVDKEYRLYPDEAFMGSQSLYLAAGPDAEDRALVMRRFHATPNQRYGLEARVRQLEENALYSVAFAIYDGSHLYDAEWQYDSENEELFLWDSTGHWKSMATGIKASAERNEWWPLKLVIDSLTGKYVRGLFLGVEYDLSAESIQKDTSGVPPSSEVQLEVENSLGATTQALFDNVIVTQNEP